MRARHVAAVGERLLVRLKKKDAKDFLENAITKFPCRSFVPEALSLYADSGNFATANECGAELLLPHAKFLSIADIERLNTIIRENEWDQILQANQTATILSQVFPRNSPSSSGFSASLGSYC